MGPHSRRTARQAALLVVDMQEKVLATIPRRPEIEARVLGLIRGARALDVPALATEQYPKGLGPTIPGVAELIPDRPEKSSFHCLSCATLLEQLHGRNVRHVTLAGIEAHVCVAQTALELLTLGFAVQVAADAVGSFRPRDAEFAFRRLERAGAVVSTTEAILFEWTESSDHPQFRAISNIVKDLRRGGPPGLPSPD